MDPEIKTQITSGREHYQSGEYDKAEPLLLAVLAAHDGFADLHNMVGVIRYQRGQVDVARLSFERAIEINPSYTEAALNLAVCYNELGRYADAKLVYSRATRPGSEPLQRPGSERLDGFVRGKIANLHAEVAAAYASVGMQDPAIVELRMALKLCPTFADLRTRLACSLRDSGHVDEALDELIGLRDSSPEYLPGRTHLGLTLWTAGRRDEARVEWRYVLEKDPGNRSAKLYLAMNEPE